VGTGQIALPPLEAQAYFLLPLLLLSSEQWTFAHLFTGIYHHILVVALNDNIPTRYDYTFDQCKQRSSVAKSGAELTKDLATEKAKNNKPNGIHAITIPASASSPSSTRVPMFMLG